MDSIGGITPLPPNEDDFEPQMLVRAFSIEVQTRCEQNLDGASEAERSLIETMSIRERHRQEHIRKINEYLEATR